MRLAERTLLWISKPFTYGSEVRHFSSRCRRFMLLETQFFALKFYESFSRSGKLETRYVL